MNLSQLCDPPDVKVPRDRNKAAPKGGEFGWGWSSCGNRPMTQAHSLNRALWTRVSDKVTFEERRKDF